ncbi:MAG: M3 family metallopeptidase [Rhizobiaceae bacterium]|jgi:peptidyl-dipeptidase Dcp|nr:M3 family metallopeptidase [Rhizobiaceae bacterium]
MTETTAREAATAANASLSPLTRWTGPDGLPDFTALRDEDFAPAFDAAFAAHRAEIDAITANGDQPTIANTLLPLERAGDALDRVSSLFWLKAGAHTNEAIQTLERDIAPKMAQHWSAIAMDKALFIRIEALWQGRAALNLDGETARVLDETRAGFVRAGALLDEAAQTRLKAIGERLAVLGATFGQNVLKDESDWALMLQPDELEGLPEFLVSAMAGAAAARGKAGQHAITLSRSIAEPFLALSPRRDLRETVWRAFVQRGQNGGATDNTAIIAETLALRAEKAQLLGFASFADYRLERTMAKTPAAVHGLLAPVWEASRAKAAKDQAALAALAAETGLNHDVAPWDWRFLAEKLRARTYDFDEGALKPYLPLDRMIEAAFDVANRLFGLTFEEMPGVPLWHADARIWRVKNAQGGVIAHFAGDWFNRPSKRSGAWMSGLQGQHKLDGGQRPIIYNICNFAKPEEGKAALLSFDDARTLFHEFGHALHGMLSDVTWPSVAGTSVYRDFVELPSQLYEHWLSVPDVLQKHARHAETGEPMPQALMAKLKAARTFDAAFASVEFTASALMDMAFHATPVPPEDPMAFEAEELARMAMPDAIAMRHRSPHFQHVFSGEGYAAGYYSYLWSEVLDADAFAAFEETGDPFNPDLARRLKENIYAAGGAKDPAELYTAFRGRMPAPDAMMKKRGLA